MPLHRSAKTLLPLAALLLAAAAPATLAEIEAAAPPGAWRPVAPDDLVLIDTAKGTLAIELAPKFAPAHVAAIRRLVRDGAFAGGAVVRVQDDYVVQFTAKPAAAKAAALLPAEYERAAAGLDFTPLPYPDAYAAAGFSDGWPVARNGAGAWLVHCYAMVGVGRDMPPDTGDGRELYAVIGHAPRHLDRNIALVGRVVAGIERFAALPRGSVAMGFYATDAEKLPITAARLASDMAAAARPRFEVMRTDTPSFAALVDARANRRESFFVRPAARVDLCNVRIPVRQVEPLPR